MSMEIYPQPHLVVRCGGLSHVAHLLVNDGLGSPAVVTGGRSVRGKEQWGTLVAELMDRGMDLFDVTVRGEPGPEVVNGAIDEIRRDLPHCDAVVAVGGGSVIDAAKAIAAGLAMAREEDASPFDITDYLEGVGTREPSGATVPLYAVPTTAGTGSEASRNAVISRIGEGGFKKSLRHTRYVPRVAVIDAELHVGCPRDITLASGLDAITQLLEAYLSPESNEVLDALALCGLASAGRSFPALLAGEEGVHLREEMACAAYLSGVCLTSAGLGVVHGLASPMGALHDIPHGVVCGLLVAPAMEAALNAPEDHWRRPEVSERIRRAGDALQVNDGLVEWLYRVAEGLPRLGSFGFTREDIPRLAGGSPLKNNPVTLAEDQVAALVEAVL